MTQPLLTVNDLVVRETSTLREALIVIDKNAQGIVFVIDEKGRMVGLLTDGDMRRALLGGADLTKVVKEVMNRHFISLPVETPAEEIQARLDDRVRHIPLLDPDGRPVDYASLQRHHRIPIMEPFLGGNELAYVTDCIKTGWISSQGKYVIEFEKQFAAFHGAAYALAVSNGTAALHLAMVSMGIGSGDEVLVPNLTFAASANTVIHAGAVPVLVDVSSETWTIDPQQVEKLITPRTRAMMPVHLYGHPCDMTPLLQLAKDRNLLVVEDCAESLGAKYKGQLVGTLGDAGCFSFFGNKLITTGEGGMIVFRDQKLYEKAKRLRDHGMDPNRRYWHLDVGYNYRMTNLQAAVGVAQMEQLNQILEMKMNLARRYDQLLKDLPGISLPPRASWAENVHWLYTILVNDAFGVKRDDVMEKLLLNGVETRPVFYPLHDMPPYHIFAGRGHFPISTELSTKGLSLPSSTHLPGTTIQRISETLHTIHSTSGMIDHSRRTSQEVKP